MTGPSPRVAEILIRYMAGENVKRLAWQHGCTTSNIYQMAGTHGARMLRPKRGPSGMVPVIIDMREHGYSYREIEDHTGITRPGISLALKRWRPDLLAATTSKRATGPQPIDREPALPSDDDA